MNHSRKTAAEISRLVNKFPGLGEDVFVHEHDFNQVANSLAAATAKLAEFEQDALRYRWLRRQNTVPYPSDFRPGTTDNLIVFWDNGNKLDAAIDAAKGSQP